MNRSLGVCALLILFAGCKQLPAAPVSKQSDAECAEIEAAINGVLPGGGVRYSGANEITVSRTMWDEASKESRYRMVTLEAKASACRFDLPPNVQAVKVRDGLDGSEIGTFTIDDLR